MEPLVKSGRVVVFIDGANLFHALTQAFGDRTRIDLERFVRKLAEGPGRELVRAYYYNARGPQGTDSFYEALTWMDYIEPRFGKLVTRDVQFTCPHCEQRSVVPTLVQKGVDVMMALDLVLDAIRDRYDVAVLVSGDADLAGPVRLVKELSGKFVENAFLQGFWAPDLRQVCDRKVVINADFLQDCLLKERSPNHHLAEAD